MSAAFTGLSRREFIGSVAAAGSLVFGFPTTAAAQGQPPEVNAWVALQPDETVVIRIARSEMGQGTLTSLARKRVWGNFSTGGSRGVRESHDYVRKGGAAARMMLMQAAADEWKVPAAECSATAGVITHAGSQRKTSYGAVAAAAAQPTAPTTVALKDPKDWKLAGKRLARLDTVDKTTSKQFYGADLQLPGMLNAAILACPVFGGTLKGYKAEAVAKMPGVKRVLAVSDNAVAVVADFNAILKAGLDAEQAVVGNSFGDAKAASAGAARNAAGPEVSLLAALTLSAVEATTLVVGDGIPQPVTATAGDAARGRAIVVNRQQGLCLLCHSGPFAEVREKGNLASNLQGAGTRWTAAQLRLATTQTLTALALMNDGSVWQQQVDVIVTLAACIES